MSQGSLAEAGRSWPLVGRETELRVAIPAVDRGGLFVVGEMGVGKSRLLASVVDELVDAGLEVIRVAGFDSSGTLPLAPLLPVLAEEAATPDPARRILSELYRRTRRGRVVLVVDDAHLLDPASAGVIHQVASNELAPVLTAVRSPEARPAAIDALWRDEHVERLVLSPLTRAATDELVQRSLGSDVEPATMARIWGLTRGYPLYLRELLTGALEAGTLEQDGDGTWFLARGTRLPERLEEVVAGRLRDLEADQRAVVEYVSLAPGITRSVLDGLTSADALDELLRRNILALRSNPGGDTVEPAHPIFGEVTLVSTTSSGLDRRRRMLGAALADAGESPARAAGLLLDAGEPVSSQHLERAIREARSSLDPTLLERLAGASAETSGDAGAMVARAEALAMQHRAAESDEQFREALTVASESDRAAIRLRWMMAVHDFDTGVGSEHFWKDLVDSQPIEDPGLEEVLLRATLFLDPPKARQVAERCRRLRSRSGVPEPVRARAQMVEATAHMWAARSGSALEVLGSAPLDALDPLDTERARFTRIWALGWSGQLREAEAAAKRWMARAGSSDDADVAALASTVGAFVATFTGDLPQAIRLFDASLRLQPMCSDVRATPVTYCLRAMYLPELSTADQADVVEAVRACEELPDIALRLPGAALVVAQSRLERLSGRGDGVAPLLEVRQEMDHRPGELFDLHVLAELLLMGRIDEVVEPLQNLGESGVIEWWGHAAEMANGSDAQPLESLAGAVAKQGATGMAACFAALANRLHGQLGDAVGVVRSHRLHRRLRDQLPGTRSLVAISPGPLTGREDEVVDLVLAGHTNRHIAETLFVSERTVEGHLHRTYRKLGLDGRNDLARLEVAPNDPEGSSRRRS